MVLTLDWFSLFNSISIPYGLFKAKIRFICKCLIIIMTIDHIGQMSRMFANGPGDQGSIPGKVIPKTHKMVLDAALLNTQHYKVRNKGKVEQSRERSSALPYTSV